MKKVIYSLMAIFALSLAFVSCSDDTIDHGTHVKDPQSVAKGTYKGTLTIYKASLEDTIPVVKENSIVAVEESENHYSVKMTMTSGQADADGSYIANISWANSDMKFSGVIPSNTTDKESIGFGSSAVVVVNGEISAAGNLIMSYSKTVKVGRSSNTYFYKYVGKKE